jgi:hypothetical protein
MSGCLARDLRRSESTIRLGLVTRSTIADPNKQLRSPSGLIDNAVPQPVVSFGALREGDSVHAVERNTVHRHQLVLNEKKLAFILYVCCCKLVLLIRSVK